MEPSNDVGEWAQFSPPLDSLEDYFAIAALFAESCHEKIVNRYRSLRFDEATPIVFWFEYIWCVYTSGFRASVVSKIFPELMDSYKLWRITSDEDPWPEIFLINAHRGKYDAVKYVADLMVEYETSFEDPDEWWPVFKDEFLKDPETMKKLPFIGSVTCYHLARNLGHDAVKPDLHLVRLAKHFECESPLAMCDQLSKQFNERVGVVDLILFYAASTWGTIDIKGEGR